MTWTSLTAGIVYAACPVVVIVAAIAFYPSENSEQATPTPRPQGSPIEPNSAPKEKTTNSSQKEDDDSWHFTSNARTIHYDTGDWLTYEYQGQQFRHRYHSETGQTPSGAKLLRLLLQDMQDRHRPLMQPPDEQELDRQLTQQANDALDEAYIFAHLYAATLDPQPVINHLEGWIAHLEEGIEKGYVKPKSGNPSALVDELRDVIESIRDLPAKVPVGQNDGQ